MKTGIELIRAERERQIKVEGFSAFHDSQHNISDLARAAICYAINAIKNQSADHIARIQCDRAIKIFWPWRVDDYKPTAPIRDLVKAGALIAAEIDRLQLHETD